MSVLVKDLSFLSCSIHADGPVLVVLSQIDFIVYSLIIEFFVVYLVADGPPPVLLMQYVHESYAPLDLFAILSMI